jgi:hypothetical protein
MSSVRRRNSTPQHDIFHNMTLGRYIQPDPLGFIDGPNVYNYVLENPIAYLDPTGRQASSACLAGGLYNPACEIGMATDALRLCIAAGAALIAASSNTGSCSASYYRFLRDAVNKGCKPRPKSCEAGESCAWTQARITQFNACADARKRIMDACFNGGDKRHGRAYTRERLDANLCQGLLPVCTSP